MTKTNEQTGYKVVDMFNGWEGETFGTEDAAQEAADKMGRERRKQAGMANTYNTYAAVPTGYTWEWNQRRNRFEWQ